MEKTSTYPIFTPFSFPSSSSWYAEVWHPWHLLYPSSPSCQVRSTALLVSIFTISHLDPQNSSLHLNSLPPAPLVTHLTYNLNIHLIPLLKHNSAPPLKGTNSSRRQLRAAIFGPSLPSSHILFTWLLYSCTLLLSAEDDRHLACVYHCFLPSPPPSHLSLSLSPPPPIM